MSFDQIVRIILENYFLEAVLSKRFTDSRSPNFGAKKINKEEFYELVVFSCFFLELKPSANDLYEVFTLLDKDRDGFITM